MTQIELIRAHIAGAEQRIAEELRRIDALAKFTAIELKVETQELRFKTYDPSATRAPQTRLFDVIINVEITR